MASTDARPIPRKNAAYRLTFPILDADGDLVTGATGLDSEVSIDGGTFADCTNEATEIATASGMYYLDLTSAEMNGDTVAIIVKTSSSGAKTTPVVLYPEEIGDLRVDVVQISGDTTAADNAESFFDGTGYAGTNNVIPTVTTVNGLANNVITATAIAADAITAAKVAADVTTEIQSGLATAASIAALNNLSAAQVNAEVDTALADVGLTTTITGRIDAAISSRATPAQVATELGTYDAPTKAELDAAVAPLATAAALDTVDNLLDTEIGALTTSVAAILDDTGTAGVVLSTAQMQALADIILGRSVATVEASASTHSIAELILGILESSTSGTTWTIKRTNGTTTFNTRTLTLDEDALPVTGVA